MKFKPTVKTIFITFVLSSIMVLAVSASSKEDQFDWPGWRGPNRDGVSSETNWNSKWPKEGPKVAWKTSIGIGYSPVSVSNGRAYTIGNQDGKDTVYCFDAVTGEKIWTHSYPCSLRDKYHDGGPASSPTIADGNLFTVSRDTDLYCFDAETGDVIWHKKLVDVLGIEIPTFGFCGSPLIDGSNLILDAGPTIALDKKTGDLIWKSEHHEAWYSTPIKINLGSRECIVASNGKGFSILDKTNGITLSHFPWKTDHKMNVAPPIVSGDKMFISSGYERGCALLEIGESQLKSLYENTNMRNHFNPCVLWEGHLYGFDGNVTSPDGIFRCIEFDTGKVKWSESSLKDSSVMLADGKLIVLTSQGELVIAEATPSSFKEISRAQVLGGQGWTAPVLSNQRIYCRNSKGDLVCVDVKAEETPAQSLKSSPSDKKS